MLFYYFRPIRKVPGNTEYRGILATVLPTTQAPNIMYVRLHECQPFLRMFMLTTRHTHTRHHFTGTSGTKIRLFSGNQLSLYSRLMERGRIFTWCRVKACESGQAWDD